MNEDDRVDAPSSAHGATISDPSTSTDLKS